MTLYGGVGAGTEPRRHLAQTQVYQQIVWHSLHRWGLDHRLSGENEVQTSPVPDP